MACIWQCTYCWFWCFLCFINDGATNKFLLTANGDSTVTSNDFYDFNVFLRAGDVLRVSTSTASLTNTGVVRQLADINGNLVNP